MPQRAVMCSYVVDAHDPTKWDHFTPRDVTFVRQIPDHKLLLLADTLTLLAWDPAADAHVGYRVRLADGAVMESELG